MSIIGPGVTNCSVQNYDKGHPDLDSEDEWLQKRIDDQLSKSESVTTVTLVGPPGSKSAAVSVTDSVIIVTFQGAT